MKCTVRIKSKVKNQIRANQPSTGDNSIKQIVHIKLVTNNIWKQRNEKLHNYNIISCKIYVYIGIRYIYVYVHRVSLFTFFFERIKYKYTLLQVCYVIQISFQYCLVNYQLRYKILMFYVFNGYLSVLIFKRYKLKYKLLHKNCDVHRNFFKTTNLVCIDYFYNNLPDI